MNKALLGVYFICFQLLISFASGIGQNNQGVDLFAEVYSIFYYQYYPELDDREFIEKLLQGGIPAFDKYCHYADPNLKKLEEENGQGSFYGIGLKLGQGKFKGEIVLMAMSVMDGSPAARAGIRSGDYIVAIASDGVTENAVLTDNLSIQSAVQLIRGEKNKKVFLKVARKDELL